MDLVFISFGFGSGLWIIHGGADEDRRATPWWHQ
jgi:hypothetical protein